MTRANLILAQLELGEFYVPSFQTCGLSQSDKGQGAASALSRTQVITHHLSCLILMETKGRPSLHAGWPQRWQCICRPSIICYLQSSTSAPIWCIQMRYRSKATLMTYLLQQLDKAQSTASVLHRAQGCQGSGLYAPKTSHWDATDGMLTELPDVLPMSAVAVCQVGHQGRAAGHAAVDERPGQPAGVQHPSRAAVQICTAAWPHRCPGMALHPGSGLPAIDPAACNCQCSRPHAGPA